MEKDQNNIELYEEPPLEDFYRVEPITEKDLARKKLRAKFLKFGAVVLAFVFLINGLAVWFEVINIPALEFVKTSYRLSQMESIQKAKQAVVTIQGDNVKGTGFNIKEDGLIITNSHVVEKMSSISIYFPSGQVFRGKVIKDRPELDIAIVEIEGSNLPCLPLQSQQNWQINDEVFVIGNPLAYTQIANEGIIEGTTLVENRSSPVLKISAPIFRGNSGSPVLTAKNEVIGVVFATTVPKLKDSEKPSGLVVPIDQVNEMLKNNP